MKKKTGRIEKARERHGETCLCRRCRSRIESLWYEKDPHKIKPKGHLSLRDFDEDD